jgi:hypothetical protein
MQTPVETLHVTSLGFEIIQNLRIIDTFRTGQEKDHPTFRENLIFESP